MCSGCSTSATEASVNAPSNQPPHHPSYNNAATYGCSDTLSTCKSSLPVRRVYDFNPNFHGWKRPRGRPKTRWADFTSSTTFIMLASMTPPMLPRWSLTDPSGRPLLADCQHSNSSKDFVKISVLGRTHLCVHWPKLKFNRREQMLVRTFCRPLQRWLDFAIVIGLRAIFLDDTFT